MADQMNRLQVVLRNMHHKKLISQNEVDSFLDGALRANVKINDILVEFFSEGSSSTTFELEVLEKRILSLTRKEQSEQENHSNSSTTTTAATAATATTTKRTSNSSNNNTSGFTHPSQQQFGDFFSTTQKNNLKQQQQLENQKFISALNPSKQQAFLFLKSVFLDKKRHNMKQRTTTFGIPSSNSTTTTDDRLDQQKLEESKVTSNSAIEDDTAEDINLDELCEDLLINIINPDRAVVESAEKEIQELIVSKKNMIKKKIDDATQSLLKASIVPCDALPIVQHTRNILKALFGIGDFEIARLSDSLITQFSSSNVTQSTKEIKNGEELRSQFTAYPKNKVILLNDDQKEEFGQLFKLAEEKDSFIFINPHEGEIFVLVFHMLPSSKNDSFFHLLQQLYYSNQLVNSFTQIQLEFKQPTRQKNNFDNSFDHLFKEQITSLLCIFVRDQDYLQKKYLHKLIKIIEVYIKKSELILIEEIRQSFQSYFKTPAQSKNLSINLFEQYQITFGWEQLKQSNSIEVGEEDTCPYEISIPISKISLKCNLNKSHTHKFIHLQLFEKTMTAVHSQHHQKIKTLLSRFTNYSYFLHNNEIVMMDFNRKGHLKFISQTLSHTTIESLKIRISNANNTENMESEVSFQYEQIFSANPKILQAIDSILSDPSQFSSRMEGEPHAEIIVNPQTRIGAPRGFKLFLKQAENNSKNLISFSSPSISSMNRLFQNSLLSQVSKVKRAMQRLSFLTLTSKTAMSKDMVLKDPNVKNSWVREYLPDQDLIKIQEDESNSMNQSQDISVTLRANQPRLFNPSTTFHQPSDALLASQNISKPQASDLIAKDEEDSQLNSFRFDILKSDPKEKVRIVWSIFQKRGYFEKYSIPIPQFCEFINEIRYKYNKRGNPFHNFDHGITVMHGCYMISCETSASTLIKDLHEFALVFSGLCHDVSHTARTNVFEVNSMSKLAIRYHDKSVLEQHHIAVTFKILKKKESNIFAMLPHEQLQAIRKIAISNIMATDIKQHFDLLKNFELRFGQRSLSSSKHIPSITDITASSSSASNIPNMTSSTEVINQPAFSEQDISLLSNMIIHAADFHGNAQEFDLSKRWSLLVNQEFQAQFKEEGEKNIPQTMYLKDLDKRDTLARSEIGFINAIVKPLWGLLNKFLGDDLAVPTQNLSNNIKLWDEISKEGTKPEPTQPKSLLQKKPSMLVTSEDQILKQPQNSIASKITQLLLTEQSSKKSQEVEEDKKTQTQSDESKK